MKRSETNSLETISERGELNRREFVQRLGLSGILALMLSAGEARRAEAQVLSPCQMSGHIIGGIRMFAFAGKPHSCLEPCNGQLLSIATNVALFAILDKTFGGNGTTNFAVPDFRRTAPRAKVPTENTLGFDTVFSVDSNSTEDDSEANYLVINFCITAEGVFPSPH